MRDTTALEEIKGFFASYLRDTAALGEFKGLFAFDLRDTTALEEIKGFFATDPRHYRGVAIFRGKVCFIGCSGGNVEFEST
ncbi:hypothetical protein [Paenibacillus donghaensis]|uniref:Uncharacterized protein n=1 Tax=Paenibacillus donghaensis TaxID=414771 RepID=A0A2Z2KL99_9BACL|nr:hypothetical protein [Paenibacillus donghaensis]ASA24200.1 hypothetical protein B9T62_27590 [Paenibacillus donghaensis]